MDWQYGVLSIIGVLLINQPLAYWLYKRRVRKSQEKFLAHVRVQYPGSTVTFSSVASSDLDAIQMVKDELDNHPDGPAG